MMSFQFMVVGLWLIMLAVSIKRQMARHGLPSGQTDLYLNAAFLFWTILGFFFMDALVNDTCLVPGDILYNYYPWKAAPDSVPPHNPLLSDIPGCVYPWMAGIQKSFRALELPLWNPYAYSGSPFAGNQVSAVFHPFNLFLFVMPLADAATWFPFLRLFIAAMGMFSLLISWRISRWASIFGAILYALCGVHISWLANYPEVSVTMLIPWIVISLDQIALRGSHRWWLIFIGLSVIQFLGGHCETSFHVYAWATPFFFIRLFQRHKKKGPAIFFSRTGLFVSACIFSLGISAFQLLPFLEYLPLSTRMHEIATRGSNLFTGLDFISVFVTVTSTLISPDFYGSPVTGNYWGAFNFIEQNTHITVTGLFFAIMAVVGKIKNQETRFLKFIFLWGGLTAYLIAVRTPGLFDFVVSLPLFKQNSNHRLIIIFSFAFSILAAFEAHEVQTSGYRPICKSILVAGSILLSAMALHHVDVTELTTEQLHHRWRHLYIFFVFGGLGLLLYLISILFVPIKKYLPLAATGLILIETFTWGGNFNPFIARNNIFPSMPLIDFIKSQEGLFRVAAFSNAMPSGTEQFFHIDSISGLDPMKTYGYEKIYSQISGKYNSIYTGHIPAFSSPWINFLNVRYVVAPPGTSAEDLGNSQLQPVYHGFDGEVYYNPNAFERIFRVKKCMTAKNDTSALKLLSQNLHQLDKVAIIEGKNTLCINAALSSDLTTEVRPRLLKRTNHTMLFDFNGVPGGFYVAGLQFYPGWKLDIDGRKGAILKTNSTFMGFQIPENTSLIKLYYSPMSFKLGVSVSVLCILLLLGLQLKGRQNPSA